MRFSFPEPLLQGILKLFLNLCFQTAETWHFLSNDSQIMSQFKHIQEVNKHGQKDGFPEKTFSLLLILSLALALINTSLKTFGDTSGKGSQPLLPQMISLHRKQTLIQTLGVQLLISTRLWKNLCFLSEHSKTYLNRKKQLEREILIR